MHAHPNHLIGWICLAVYIAGCVFMLYAELEQPKPETATDPTLNLDGKPKARIVRRKKQKRKVKR